ncbi:hypothetical protein NC651_009984 [Populus alba x Populus x berolinensis]|nr:hypothetical protein NC651_009984 [Populus alba x Populus x berolinensis]
MENNLNEAKVAHHQLCSLVEVSDAELLGPRRKNLHKIVTVYVEILWAGKKLATEETNVYELFLCAFTLFALTVPGRSEGKLKCALHLLCKLMPQCHNRLLNIFDSKMSLEAYAQRDDKNLDLSRFSAHGKKTLARIAAALGEEQVARTNSRRRQNQLLLGRDNEGSHKQTISFMKQNGGH